RMLHDLAARGAGAKSEAQAFRIAVDVLSGNELDLPFVLAYRFDDPGGEAELVSGNGWSGYEVLTGSVRGDTVPAESGIPWPFAEAIRAAREVVVDDLSARFGPLPPGRWNARPERAIVLPLALPGRNEPSGFLVAGISPHRAFDERYRLFF